MTEGASKLLQT